MVRVLVVANVRAMQELYPFTIDTARNDSLLPPYLLSLGRRSVDVNNFASLLAKLGDGDVGHVIVWKLDRLTRRTKHLLNLLEDVFLAKGIELHSVSESLDTSTPHGRFVLTLFGGLAQMERELIGERTRSAMAFKREQLQPTSHPPLGFRANGSRHRMIPVPDELKIVRRIIALWEDDAPCDVKTIIDEHLASSS